MADINTVTLTGRAVRDAEMFTLPNGTIKARFTVACNHTKERVSFLDVEFFDKTADIAGKYVTKGKQVALTGRIEQDRWEKDGVKRSAITIRGTHLLLLDKPEKQDVEDIDETIDLADIPF